MTMTEKTARSMQAEQQERTRAAWDKISAGFDEFATPLTITLAEDALRLVGLRPGMRFLDVAAGSGALSIPAARIGAQVVATDLSPGMIERLEARARREGVRLEARAMDGNALAFEDDTFDIAGSQNGVTLFPDLRRGLTELVRVTKRGGRALIVAFGPLTKAEFLGFFMGALRAVVPGFAGLPLDPPPLPFRTADPENLRQELAQAGLKGIRVETVAWAMEFRSATHLWDMVMSSNPLGAMLVADLTEGQRAAVRRALDGMLRERFGDGSTAVLNTEVNIGIGTK